MLRTIFPDSFTHWKVKSSKHNTVLCLVAENAYNPIIRHRKELGLFWEFQSPDSEFVYLPAVFPRDESGKIRLNRAYNDEVAPVVWYERNKKWKDPLEPFGSGRSFNDAYSFRHHFAESEAKAYVDLLKHVDRGTEDHDDTVYSEKCVPSLKQRLNLFWFLVGVPFIIWLFLKYSLGSYGE